MRGKMIAMIRKWWLTFLVFTLALSLTSCSKKKQALEDQSVVQCGGGSIGDFALFITRSPNNPALYEMTLQALGGVVDGDVATIALIQKSDATITDYKILKDQEVLTSDPNAGIYAGTITESDLVRFPLLAIEGVGANDVGVPFPFRNPPKATYCLLPEPDPGFSQK